MVTKTRKLLCPSLVVLLVAGAWLWRQSAMVEPVGASDGLERGPYMQCVTPSSATVVWRSLGEATPWLHYGLSPDQLDRVCELDAIRVVTDAGRAYDQVAMKYMEDDHDAIQYEATLSDLQPESVYYYVVGLGDRRAATTNSFHTWPRPGTEASLRLWALGCSGTGASDAWAVHAGMQSFVQASGRPLDLMLHMGDMAYNDGFDHEFQRGFFEPYADTLRSVPCYPALGNHEGHLVHDREQRGPYFDAYVLPAGGEADGHPSGSEAYYSFRYGRVHFVSLNSYNLAPESHAPMMAWLRSDLENAALHADWLVAYFHHPPYSKGSHDSDVEPRLVWMRENVVPVLEEAGVDLVLSAHSHCYERSMLVDGAYQTPTVSYGHVLNDGDGDPQRDGWYKKPAGLQPHAGTVYVVAGNGGAKMYQRGVMPIMRRTMRVFGSLLLDFDGPRCEGRMIDRKGRVRDHFGILKEGATLPTALDRPWQLTGPTILPYVRTFLEQARVMFVSTTLWEGESLHYTLDGTEPTRQ